MSVARAKRPRRREAFGMNMTPMIDVTFQLITFFMVVATMSRLELEANLNLPLAQMAVVIETPEVNRLVINVDNSGQIIIYGRNYSYSELENFLKSNAAEAKKKYGKAWKAKTPVLVRCDKGIRWSTLRVVLDKIYRARFRLVQMGAYSPDTQRK